MAKKNSYPKSRMSPGPKVLIYVEKKEKLLCIKNATAIFIFKNKIVTEIKFKLVQTVS